MRCLVDKVLKKLGKLPFSTLIAEDDFDNDTINHNIITAQELHNDTIRTTLRTVERECSRTCPSHGCDSSIMVTELLLTGETADNSIQFRVNLPNFASFYVQYLPFMILNEYLIYVMSCLGTWLGVSVIELNPVEMFTRKRRRLADTEKLQREMKELRSYVVLVTSNSIMGRYYYY